MHVRLLLPACCLFLMACTSAPQEEEAQTDSNTPLHLVEPSYPVPYEVPTTEQVKATLDSVLAYLQEVTPMQVENADGAPVSAPSAIDSTSRLHRGDFRLTSYEWGVTYSAMLSTGALTGDSAYIRYATDRLSFLAQVAPAFEQILEETGRVDDDQMLQVIRPRSLDDCGAMCSAMIKAVRTDSTLPLGACIDRYMHHILYKEYRLQDGTFARKRPQYNSVWLDDLFMGTPSIALYATVSQDSAARLYLQATEMVEHFTKRMWVPERCLFRHGWVEAMDPHPSFFWARANGWAMLTLCEVLDALPADHPRRPSLLALLREHAYGIAALQSGEGRWHQLLDRSDTYLETSASAIFVYCLAHAINQGWIDYKVYGPVVNLGWQAVAHQVNARGQVEGTCVGTGMAFDAAYYYHRPVTPYAAHGYGPLIWAGGEMIALLQHFHPRLNNNTVTYYDRPQGGEEGTFTVEP